MAPLFIEALPALIGLGAEGIELAKTAYDLASKGYELANAEFNELALKLIEKVPALTKILPIIFPQSGNPGVGKMQSDLLKILIQKISKLL